MQIVVNRTDRRPRMTDQPGQPYRPQVRVPRASQILAAQQLAPGLATTADASCDRRRPISPSLF
jgi:hypothetical protein